MLFDLPINKNQDPKETASGGSEGIKDIRSLPGAAKLSACIDLLSSYQVVQWVTKGDWNQHDLLTALLQMTGPAEVTISSYAFSEYPARLIAEHVQSKMITSLYCIIDKRIDTRSASSLAILRNACSKYKLCSTHAKVTLLENTSNQIVCVGSANYTVNKRWESGLIITLPEAFSFHKNWINDAFNSDI